jgi:SpoIID/LytB domain protein
MLDLNTLFEQQMAQWPECRERYEQLANAGRRKLVVDGREYELAYNPGRSTSAKALIINGKPMTMSTEKKDEPRPCFLCEHALPEQQLRVPVKTLPLNHEYLVAVNPFPIIDHHFTIICKEHVRQDFKGRMWDMAFFADLFPDYLIFFNGACSGASAPDHMHFQAVPKRCVPLTRWSEDVRTQLGVTQHVPHIEDSDHKNIVTWTEGNVAYWLVIDRKTHRPSQYYLEDGDPNKVIYSPACLEFCGLVPLCREEDFNKLTSEILHDMMSQCYKLEPMLHVGVMEGQEIRFSADERVHAMHYVGEDRMKDVMDYSSNRVEVQEMDEYWTHSEPFTLEEVTIGKQFHWQQKEDQVFRGSLHIIAREGQLHAINLIPVEEYLKSVISSEMAATNSSELLKAHAIISRSWVLRQIKNGRTKNNEAVVSDSGEVASSTGLRLVKYWDHTDHHLYDVCADDHCQRYQGITRQASPLVEDAIQATRGIVLTDEKNEICDARFSKCCGGRTELFSTCWQDVDYDYLRAVDDPYCSPEFIEKLPGGMDAVLKQVLNNYDQSTVDFHDWRVEYSKDELSELVEKKLVLGLGEIQHIEPLEKGASGRIKFLKIVGSEKTIEIGKELLIRKAFSETHLYSSWFDVEESLSPEDGQKRFVLKGHGWGHGVGLCQIGAAAMALQGFKAEAILAHYYPGAHLTQLY